MERLDAAKTILKTLEENGYEAYIIGGYVRDLILNVPTGDIDMTTNARPEDIQRVFKRTVLTGVKHGTVTVIIDKFQFEVTTFRSEGAYTDHRRPDEVVYVDRLEEDVKRRDFTMNALALDQKGTVIDYVNGKEAIRNKEIRTVGIADQRFLEDALRMLRGFRFVSKLGFNFKDDVKAAIIKNGHLIRQVASERILKEIENLIKGDHFLRALKEMIATNFDQELPLFEKGINKIVTHSFQPKNLSEFLAVCVIFETEPILEKLPIANTIKREVKLIVEMYEVELTDFSPVVLFRNGLEACLSVNHLNQTFRRLPDQKQAIEKTFKELPIYRQCDLAFKGDAIIEFYQKEPGGWIGEILDEIVLMVILGEVENDYEKIRQYLLKKK